MPRMTQEEFDADLAAAKMEGAQEVAHLVAGMNDLGLGLAAISGALRGHVADLHEQATRMRADAVASRQKPVEGEEPPRAPEPLRD